MLSSCRPPSRRGAAPPALGRPEPVPAGAVGGWWFPGWRGQRRLRGSRAGCPRWSGVAVVSGAGRGAKGKQGRQGCQGSGQTLPGPLLRGTCRVPTVQPGLLPRASSLRWGTAETAAVGTWTADVPTNKSLIRPEPESLWVRLAAPAAGWGGDTRSARRFAAGGRGHVLCDRSRRLPAGGDTSCKRDCHWQT